MRKCMHKGSLVSGVVDNSLYMSDMVQGGCEASLVDLRKEVLALLQFRNVKVALEAHKRVSTAICSIAFARGNSSICTYLFGNLGEGEWQPHLYGCWLGLGLSRHPLRLAKLGHCHLKS